MPAGHLAARQVTGQRPRHDQQGADGHQAGPGGQRLGRRRVARGPELQRVAAWSASACAQAVRRCPGAGARGRRPGAGRWSRARRDPTGRSRRAPRPTATAQRCVRGGVRHARAAGSAASLSAARPVDRRTRPTSERPPPAAWSARSDGDGQRWLATVSAAEHSANGQVGAVPARPTLAVGRPRRALGSQHARRGVPAGRDRRRTARTEQPAIAARMAPHLRMTYIGTGCCGVLAVVLAAAGPGHLSPRSTGGPGRAGRSRRWSLQCAMLCGLCASRSWSGAGDGVSGAASGPRTCTPRRGCPGSPTWLVRRRAGRPAGLHGG